MRHGRLPHTNSAAPVFRKINIKNIMPFLEISDVCNRFGKRFVGTRSNRARRSSSSCAGPVLVQSHTNWSLFVTPTPTRPAPPLSPAGMCGAAEAGRDAARPPRFGWRAGTRGLCMLCLVMSFTFVGVLWVSVKTLPSTELTRSLTLPSTGRSCCIFWKKKKNARVESASFRGRRRRDGRWV